MGSEKKKKKKKKKIRRNRNQIRIDKTIYIVNHFINTCIVFMITVKPAYQVTSIKQSPVFKGHLFLSCHRKFAMN
jgi:hypothetical protein